MISLRETLRITPEFSGIMPSDILISVATRIKEFYFQLPMIYIHATLVTLTLLSAIGVGLMTPGWIN